MSLSEQLTDMGFTKVQMYVQKISFLIGFACSSDSAINAGKAANMEQAIDW